MKSNSNHPKKTSAFNDVTGDTLQNKQTNDNYRDGWDRIFGNKKEPTIDAEGEQQDKQ